MTLNEVRAKIDEIDPQLKSLIMKRLDCSYEVAKVKAGAGETNIYRADREKAIIEKLSQDVPEERLLVYLSVVKKIIETSRMYQYGLLYDWMDDLFSPLAQGLDIKPGANHILLRLTKENHPGSMASIFGVIGDYGVDVDQINLITRDDSQKTVTFELVILGNLNDKHIRILLFQLSRESNDFKILKNY